MSQQAQETVVVLKPCPFCGGEAKLKGYGQGYWCACEECGNGPCRWNKPDAITAWNRRAAPVSPDSDLLKEAVGLLRVFVSMHGTAADLEAARAFLSKVEERG